ncbi:hypothetical protein LJR034_001718 [Caballeronia sp. LjRoot34]|uniref:hypothetical protein n=1 Tax=Caballeronia sp. LjRoot34 TaxID=3342325 RepID=UPI003ECE3DB6
MDKPIEITHYTSFAIDDLLFPGKQWKAERPQSARQIGSLVDLMRRGVKFLLPNCAELIDEKSIGEAHLELLRLPYPVTIFEAPWELDRPVDAWLNGAPQSRSSRRIALCWELSEDIEPFAGLNTRYRQMFPEGGVFIFPVYYLDALRSWSPGVGGLFVPHDSRVDGHLADTPATTLAHQALRSAGRLKGKGYRFRAEPFALIPDLFAETVARFNGDEALALSQVIVDAHDEVGMVVQACTVLNCTNVQTVDVPPGRASNAVRTARNQTPFYTYKVLQLKAEAPAAHPAGGTHASPRAHLRRGHIRRLPDKTTWVRASFVNPGSERGVVDKDYALPAPGSRPDAP